MRGSGGSGGCYTVKFQLFSLNEHPQGHTYKWSMDMSLATEITEGLGAMQALRALWLALRMASPTQI